MITILEYIWAALEGCAGGAAPWTISNQIFSEAKVFKMRLPGTFYNIFFIVTFFYLMNCPLAHDLIAGHVDINAINSCETRIEKKDSKNTGMGTSCRVSENSPINFQPQAEPKQGFALSHLLNHSVNISMIAAVKLLL